MYSSKLVISYELSCLLLFFSHQTAGGFQLIHTWYTEILASYHVMLWYIILPGIHLKCDLFLILYTVICVLCNMLQIHWPLYTDS